MSFATQALLTAFKDQAREIVLQSENEKWYTTVEKIIDAQLSAWEKGVLHVGVVGAVETQVASIVERGTVCDPDQADADQHRGRAADSASEPIGW